MPRKPLIPPRREEEGGGPEEAQEGAEDSAAADAGAALAAAELAGPVEDGSRRDDPPPSRRRQKPVPTDYWSLVRTPTGQSGWVLTRLISMAIPDEVAQYAEGHRIVSYLPLGYVQDEDQKKPIWLWTTVARAGSRTISTASACSSGACGATVTRRRISTATCRDICRCC